MIHFQTVYEAPWAEIQDATSVLNTGEWRVQRPVIDQEKCRLCGECYLFCPTGSILHKGDHFEIDLTYCKGCGICARVCPTHIIEITKERR